VSACPRCGQDLDLGQEYCLECGIRIPGPTSLGTIERGGGSWIRRALLGLLVAVAGAAAGVAAVDETGGGRTELVTATGGFAAPPATDTVTLPAGEGSESIIDWPAGENGWTIALATLPQSLGKQRALARARQASRAGLTSVGVLDSSRFASLHPGYWLVFAGIYGSEAEATSALRPARTFARTAGVRRIVA
jgi:hypothetical protein